MTHPDWCARKHGALWPVYQVRIGADLLPSANLADAVCLQQVDGALPEVSLVCHDAHETTVARLTFLPDRHPAGLVMMSNVGVCARTASPHRALSTFGAAFRRPAMSRS